jgi:uncharacterized membrane protein
MMKSTIRSRLSYEQLYLVTIAIKGIDGAIELVAGILLLVIPRQLHELLSAASGEAFEHSSAFMQYVAVNIAHIDAGLASGGRFIVILFLLTHGIVKIALVWALWKKLLWAYPYALAVLGGFFVYQLYLSVHQPSFGMILFTILDGLIIWIVWNEWRRLKREV